jgi:hypothetical protein
MAALMRRSTLHMFLLAITLAGSAASGGAPARAPAIAALDILQPGQWRLTTAGEPPRNLCIGDTGLLIQLSHGGTNCTRLIIENDPRSATVQYSCPGAGWGRTTIRVETPRLAQIDTQGIAANAPFAYAAEARRVGDCQTAAAR